MRIEAQRAPKCRNEGVRLFGEISQKINVGDADVFFEWEEASISRRGISDNPNITPVKTLSKEAVFEQIIDGLDKGETYNFRAVAKDKDTKVEAKSRVLSFTTRLLNVSVNKPAEIGSITATLSGTIDDSLQIDEGIKVKFKIREEGKEEFDREIGAGTVDGDVDFTAEVDELSILSKYEYKAVAQKGSTFAESKIQTFKTDEPTIPVETREVESIGETNATVKGELLDIITGESFANVYFNYGKDNVENNETELNRIENAPKEFRAPLNRLEKGEQYKYQAVSKFKDTERFGDVKNFTTKHLTVETERNAISVFKNEATIVGDLVNFTAFDEEATVSFNFSTEESDLSNNKELEDTVNTTGRFQTTLQELEAGTQYFYQAKAESQGIVDLGLVKSFTTKEFTVETRNPEDITTKSALLEGKITIYKGFSTDANLFFQFRRPNANPPFSEIEAGSLPFEDNFKEVLDNLDPDTAYEFRAVGRSEGVEDVGVWVGFETRALEIETKEAQDVSLSFAKLRGRVFNQTGPAEVQFRYGLNKKNEETEIQTFEKDTTFSDFATALKPGKEYQFEAVGKLKNGRRESVGETLTFKTDNIDIETDEATQVLESSAVLNGDLTEFSSLNKPAKVFFEWSLNCENLGNRIKQPPEERSTTGTYNAKLEGLQGNEIYRYRAVAIVEEKGHEVRVEGCDETFKTKLLEVETVKSKDVFQTEATLVGNLSDFAGFDTSSPDVFFEYGKTGEDIDNNVLDSTDVEGGTFEATETEFEEGQVYQFRAVAESGQVVDQGEPKQLKMKNMEVSASGASKVTTQGATFNGSLDVFKHFTEDADVFFEYGDGNFSREVDSETGTLSSTGTFKAENVTQGLSSGEDYQYRAVAESQGVREVSETKTFEIAELEVSTDGASRVSNKSATLNGEVTKAGNVSNLEVLFKFGKESENFPEEVSAGDLNGKGTFDERKSGLSPGETYKYKAVARLKRNGSVIDEAEGQPETFTVKEFDVSTEELVSVGRTSANFAGRLQTYTFGEAADIGFEYKKDQDPESEYSNNVVGSGDQLSTGRFTESTSSLSGGQTYQFRAFAKAPNSLFDNNSDAKKVGSPITFSTKGIGVSTEAATNVASTSVTFEGNLDSFANFNSRADLSFEFSQNESKVESGNGQTVGAGDTSSVGSFDAQKTGLNSGSTYYYRAKASADGITETGSVKSVTLNSATINVGTENDGNATVDFNNSNVNIDFGSVTVGNTSNRVTLFVEQTSTGSFDITKTFQANSGSTGEYNINNNNIQNGETVSSNKKTVDIKFSPNSDAGSSDVVAGFTFEHNAPIVPDDHEKSPVDVIVSGQTSAPASLSLISPNGSTGTASFTAFAGETDTADVEFSNTSDSNDVTVKSLTITGDPEGNFSLNESNPVIDTSISTNLSGGSFTVNTSGRVENNLVEYNPDSNSSTVSNATLKASWQGAGATNPPDATLTLEGTKNGVEVQTLDADNIERQEARLRGSVDLTGDVSSADLSFEYNDVADGNFNNEKGAGDATGDTNYNATVSTDIKPGIVYQYKAVAEVGNRTFKGQKKTFSADGCRLFGDPKYANLNSVAPSEDTFPEIRAEVSIPNKSYGTSDELGKSNFIVCEDNYTQTIENVNFSTGAGSKLDLIIAFDTSGSQLNYVNTLETEVKNFVDDVEANNFDARYALVEYEGEENVRQSFTTDGQGFKNAVENIESVDTTNHESGFDAIKVALDEATDRNGNSVGQTRSDARKVIFLIQDNQGSNNDTKADRSEAIQLMENKNIEFRPLSEDGSNPADYKTVANDLENDRGSWEEFPAESDLPQAFDRVFNSLTAPSYRIFYQTTQGNADGSQRDVSVGIIPPGPSGDDAAVVRGSYTANDEDTSSGGSSPPPGGGSGGSPGEDKFRENVT